MSGVASTWIALAGIAFVASLIGVLLVERHARRLRLLDLPNDRSSHVVPRPRGGGLGIVVGVSLASLVAASGLVPYSRDVWAMLLAALVLALLGLWDDVRPLSIWPRLGVQTGVAIALVAVVGGIDRLPLPPPADFPLGAAGAAMTVLWLVSVMNFFNFMDGVDGLAAGQALITLSALTWAMWPGTAAGFALISAAATAAFLLRNWSPARIFLGDVGSAFLGFLLAALPLAAPPDVRPSLVLLVATSLALFLLDPVATLIVRGRRGAGLGASHREHAYQQFVEPGHSHAPLVTGMLLAGLGLSLLAGAALLHKSLAWPSVGFALLVFAVEWHMASRRRAN